MKSAIHAKRKTDAIISIRQDNNARQLIITGLNLAAEKLIGYAEKEIAGKSFNNILPGRIKELLSGYLDFEDYTSDFAAVARRIPNFQILTKNGLVLSVSLKVFNLVGQKDNTQAYELLMRDVTLIDKISELKELILNSENTIAEKDINTGLPSINSIVFALDTSYSFLRQHSAIEVCFALVEVANISYYVQTYGEYVAYEIIGTLGNIIKRCCRNEDVIGYMGDAVVGMVLIDCNLESMKTVIGRIKGKVDASKITMQNGQRITLSVSIAYTQMHKDKEMTQMIDTCEYGLARIKEQSGEGVLQV